MARPHASIHLLVVLATGCGTALHLELPDGGRRDSVDADDAGQGGGRERDDADTRSVVPDGASSAATCGEELGQPSVGDAQPLLAEPPPYAFSDRSPAVVDVAISGDVGIGLSVSCPRGSSDAITCWLYGQRFGRDGEAIDAFAHVLSRQVDARSMPQVEASGGTFAVVFHEREAGRTVLRYEARPTSAPDWNATHTASYDVGESVEALFAGNPEGFQLLANIGSREPPDVRVWMDASGAIQPTTVPPPSAFIPPALTFTGPKKASFIRSALRISLITPLANGSVFGVGLGDVNRGGTRSDHRPLRVLDFSAPYETADGRVAALWLVDDGERQWIERFFVDERRRTLSEPQIVFELPERVHEQEARLDVASLGGRVIWYVRRRTVGFYGFLGLDVETGVDRVVDVSLTSPTSVFAGWTDFLAAHDGQLRPLDEVGATDEPASTVIPRIPSHGFGMMHLAREEGGLLFFQQRVSNVWPLTRLAEPIDSPRAVSMQPHAGAALDAGYVVTTTGGVARLDADGAATAETHLPWALERDVAVGSGSVLTAALGSDLAEDRFRATAWLHTFDAEATHLRSTLAVTLAEEVWLEGAIDAAAHGDGFVVAIDHGGSTHLFDVQGGAAREILTLDEGSPAGRIARTSLAVIDGELLMGRVTAERGSLAASSAVPAVVAISRPIEGTDRWRTESVATTATAPMNELEVDHLRIAFGEDACGWLAAWWTPIGLEGIRASGSGTIHRFEVHSVEVAPPRSPDSMVAVNDEGRSFPPIPVTIGPRAYVVFNTERDPIYGVPRIMRRELTFPLAPPD